jgi:hypothetical protein
MKLNSRFVFVCIGAAAFGMLLSVWVTFGIL